MNGNAVADATGGTVPGVSVKPQQTASLNLGEPRKVRTVTIRPDGTVAGAEPPAAQPVATASAGAMTLPPQAPGRASARLRSRRRSPAPRRARPSRRRPPRPRPRSRLRRPRRPPARLRRSRWPRSSRPHLSAAETTLDRRLRRAAGVWPIRKRAAQTAFASYPAQISRPAGQAAADPQGRGERQHDLPRPRRAAVEGRGLLPLLQAAGAGRSVLRCQELNRRTDRSVTAEIS